MAGSPLPAMPGGGPVSLEPLAPEPVYWTAKGFAAVVRASEKTVYRWMREDPSLPALRIRGLVRFPRARVLRWLQVHEQGPGRARRTRNPSPVAPESPANGQNGAGSAAPCAKTCATGGPL